MDIILLIYFAPNDSVLVSKTYNVVGFLHWVQSPQHNHAGRLPNGCSEHSKFAGQFVTPSQKFPSTWNDSTWTLRDSEPNFSVLRLFILWRVSITGYLLFFSSSLKSWSFRLRMFLFQFASVFWYHNTNDFECEYFVFRTKRICFEKFEFYLCGAFVRRWNPDPWVLPRCKRRVLWCSADVFRRIKGASLEIARNIRNCSMRFSVIFPVRREHRNKHSILRLLDVRTWYECEVRAYLGCGEIWIQKLNWVYAYIFLD